MQKIVIKLILSLFIVAGFSIKAQLSKGALVDGIAAVVGDQIILESDIDQQMNYAKESGVASATRCEMLETLMSNKIMVHQAKMDTLIVAPLDKLKQSSARKYKEFLNGTGGNEKELLEKFKYKTPYEMRSAIERIELEQFYFSEKLESITKGLDVTPAEITKFYQENSSQLPEVSDEIQLSQIQLEPELTQSHKQELIDRLLQIKKEIQNGKPFEEMVQIYSDDQASIPAGGLYKNTPRGQMVKSYEGAALSLNEGEISDPVESEYGFHLIQLLKRNGNFYDSRHILLKSKPTKEEIQAAVNKLDSIRSLIIAQKISFKDAAVKYSTDKGSKFSGGIIQDQSGNDKIPKLQLPTQIGFQISGVQEGNMTEVFTTGEDGASVANIILVRKIIPAHPMSVSTDYDRLKAIVLQKKKAEIAEQYILRTTPDVFISITGAYQTCDFKNKYLGNSNKNNASL